MQQGALASAEDSAVQEHQGKGGYRQQMRAQSKALQQPWQQP